MRLFAFVCFLVALAFSRLAASGAETTNYRVWLKTEPVSDSDTLNFVSVEASPDFESFLLVADGGEIWLWDRRHKQVSSLWNPVGNVDLAELPQRIREIKLRVDRVAASFDEHKNQWSFALALAIDAADYSTAKSCEAIGGQFKESCKLFPRIKESVTVGPRGFSLAVSEFPGDGHASATDAGEVDRIVAHGVGGSRVELSLDFKMVSLRVADSDAVIALVGGASLADLGESKKVLARMLRATPLKTVLTSARLPTWAVSREQKLLATVADLKPDSILLPTKNPEWDNDEDTGAAPDGTVPVTVQSFDGTMVAELVVRKNQSGEASFVQLDQDGLFVSHLEFVRSLLVTGPGLAGAIDDSHFQPAGTGLFSMTVEEIAGAVRSPYWHSEPTFRIASATKIHRGCVAANAVNQVAVISDFSNVEVRNAEGGELLGDWSSDEIIWSYALSPSDDLITSIAGGDEAGPALMAATHLPNGDSPGYSRPVSFIDDDATVNSKAWFIDEDSVQIDVVRRFSTPDFPIKVAVVLDSVGLRPQAISYGNNSEERVRQSDSIGPACSEASETAARLKERFRWLPQDFGRAIDPAADAEPEAVSVVQMARAGEFGAIAILFSTGRIGVFSMQAQQWLWGPRAIEGADIVDMTFGGRALATLDTNGVVRLWDTTQGDSLSLGKLVSQEPGSVIFSPNGRLLAATGFGTGDGMAFSSEVSLVDLDRIAAKPLRRVRNGTWALQCFDEVLQVSDTGEISAPLQSVKPGEFPETVSDSFTKDVAAKAAWELQIELPDDADGGADCGLALDSIGGEFVGLLTASVQDFDNITFKAAAPFRSKVTLTEGSTIFYASADGIAAFDGMAGKQLWSTTLSDVPTSVVSLNEDRIAVLLNDGDIHIIDKATGSDLYRLVLFDNGRWIIATSDGAFNSSIGGDKDLYLSWGKNRLFVEQFRDQLPYADLSAMVNVNDRRADGDGMARLIKIMRFGLPPIVRLAPEDGEWPTGASKETSIRVNVSLEDQGGGIGVASVRNNGRTVASTCSPGVVAKEEIATSTKCLPTVETKGGRTFLASITLASGRNRIEVISSSGLGVQSYATAQSTKEVDAYGELPKLFVLSVGNDKYNESEGFRGLQFSRSDAEEVTAILTQFAKGSNVYADTPQSEVLVDEQVRLSNIRAQFEALSTKITENDTFVFFLSGHGVADNQNNYWYIPYGYKQNVTEDGSRYKNAIGAEQWRALFGLIQANHMLVIFDTCASGAFAGAAITRDEVGTVASTSQALDALRRSTGRHFIGAALANGVALEGYGKRGVLAGALIEGISGNAGSRHPGEVWVRELKYYIERRVGEISSRFESLYGRSQTVRSSELGDDFPLVTNVTTVPPVNPEVSAACRESTHSDATAFEEPDEGTLKKYLLSNPFGCRRDFAAQNLALTLKDQNPKTYRLVVERLKYLGLRVGKNAQGWGRAVENFQQIFGYPVTGFLQQSELASLTAK